MILFGSVIKFNNKGYALFSLVFILLVYLHFVVNRPTIKEGEVSVSALLQASIQAAVAGGSLVVAVKNNPEIYSKGKTNEGLDDSVTNADFLSHCAMQNIFHAQFPSIKLISEEQVSMCTATDNKHYPETVVNIIDQSVNPNDVTIWIDPLDATREYTEKLFKFVTTMVCVAVKGRPVIGVIHNPFDNITYWGVVGKGISDSVKSEHFSNTGGKTRITVSRSHRGTLEEDIEKHFQNYDLIIAAGAGYKVISVAKKDCDAYLHKTAIKKWDICAGNAILNAVGGRMTTKDGKMLDYFSYSDVVNKDGLIATVYNHEMFINKF